MTLLVSFVLLAFAIPLLTTFDFSGEDIHLFFPFHDPEPIPDCEGPNEIYRACKTQCSDCTHRGRCSTTKCVKGCDCIPRFFRVKPGGPCEPIGNCPKPDCKENEVFRECGPVCETCSLSRCKIIGCYHKCYCKEGYLRHANGTCIPHEECPPRNRCPRHEIFAESGPADEDCLPKQNTNEKNETQNIPACYCVEGHKRSLIGCCVPETLCPNVTTACIVQNQMYYDCIPKCNTTCRNYGSSDCKEDENCYPGCFCEPGYVMNDFQSCIPQTNCSLDIAQMKKPESFKKEDETNATSVKNDSISVTTESDSTTASSEVSSKASSEAVQDDVTTASASETSTVSDHDEKQKSTKRDKDTTKQSEAKSESYSEAKSENSSKQKESSKQEVPDDDDFDFDNSEI